MEKSFVAATGPSQRNATGASMNGANDHSATTHPGSETPLPGMPFSSRQVPGVTADRDHPAELPIFSQTVGIMPFSLEEQRPGVPDMKLE